MNYILGAHLTVNNINNNYTARAHIIILPPKQRRHVAVVYSYQYRVLKIGKTTWVEGATQIYKEGTRSTVGNFVCFCWKNNKLLKEQKEKNVLKK